MIDSNTVHTVATQGHALIDTLTSVVVGILAVVSYLGGLFHGKKKANVVPK